MGKHALTRELTALRELIDERDRLYAERALASEKSIDKADANAEKWRANANEWRAAMVDREQRFASRLETDAEFRTLRIELTSLKETRSLLLGRGAGGAAMWGYLVGAMGLVIALSTLAMTFVRK